MSFRRAALVLLVLTLVAAPATAAEPAPQVTDECGDGGSQGKWNGDSMDFEDSYPYLDIKSGRIAGLYDEAGAFAGFTASVTLCGDASASKGGYSIGWSHGDSCHTSVSWGAEGDHTPDGRGIHGQASTSAGPLVTVSEDCYNGNGTPILNGAENKYRAQLPDEAAAFNGDTLTFTVPVAALPEAAAPRLEAGSEWADIGVVAMDQGPSMWAGYADTEGNRGHLFVRTDFALQGGSYIVGEDAAS